MDHSRIIYTVSQKTVQIYFFCQNFVKFRQFVKILGIKIAQRTLGTSFSEVYSFSTSPIYINALPSAFNTVVRWHKLGEVEKNLSSSLSLCQKFSQSVEI